MSVSALIGIVEIGSLPAMMIISIVLLPFLLRRKNSFRVFETGWLDNRFHVVLSSVILCAVFAGSFAASGTVQASADRLSYHISAEPESSGEFTLKLDLEGFKPLKFEKITINIGGSGSVDCELSVTANEGYRFNIWTTDLNDFSCSGNTCSFKCMGGYGGDHYITANFISESGDDESSSPETAKPEPPTFYPLPEDEIGAYALLADGTKEYLLFHTYDICMEWLNSDELCSGPGRCYHKDGK